MRRGITVAAAVISSAALIGIGAGCGGTDSSAASTPADATTIANYAPQTDSEGKTIPAPDAAPTADSGQAAPSAPEAGTSDASSGDVAAGKTVFEANCQGCHPAGGTQAGVGPQLSNSKLDAAQIKMQVMNGKGAMPGGLATGADLDNVVAYVVSIEQ
ncbi:MAG: c-type cytochrome [Thermoleophilia bacterium]|jgi:mono/diheme cytochrome c family protein|nr:c-type cytochrome [Thermoleophilia bacterium]